MPIHLMTSWLLNIWKVKIWLSPEQKELSKCNKKHFFLFHKCSLLHIQNKTSKSVADTTFKKERISTSESSFLDSSIMIESKGFKTG